MMLKKIHFAEPSIKFNKYKNHEQNVERLKKLISTGGSKQIMMQAARDLVISKEVGKIRRERNMGVINESGIKNRR